MVVDGYGGVGKTTMLKRLESGIFDPETKLTVGLDFFSKKYNDIFERKVTAQFWDLVGAKRFSFLRPFCYKGANCVILVIDLTRPNTLEDLNYFIKVAKESNISSDQIILVGTKTDLFYLRGIESGYLNSIVEKYGFIELIETSARNNHNLDVLFELATGLAMYKRGMINYSEFSLFKKELKERIKEPYIEDYEKKTRECWCCKKTMYYYEFYDSNTNIKEERLLQLWESPHLQFFCCNCFKKLNING
ncbi:MAG: Rab family GTPase [Promethearchaeota archaeon]